MKRKLTGTLVALIMMGSVSSTMAINESRGGLMGFIAGCCFGVRSGAAYNDGKEVHWRQWVRLIPLANIVFAVWDGIDGANGMTTQDYAKKYGAIFY